jgi:hypothetical protein
MPDRYLASWLRAGDFEGLGLRWWGEVAFWAAFQFTILEGNEARYEAGVVLLRKVNCFPLWMPADAKPGRVPPSGLKDLERLPNCSGRHQSKSATAPALKSALGPACVKTPPMV